YAGISVFSGYGITINAGPSDVVTIRGLTLNGLGGSDGILFTSGAALYVRDSVFQNLALYGIEASTGANARVVVEDSLFTRSGLAGSGGAGVYLGTMQATID